MNLAALLSAAKAATPGERIVHDGPMARAYGDNHGVSFFACVDSVVFVRTDERSADVISHGCRTADAELIRQCNPAVLIELCELLEEMAGASAHVPIVKRGDSAPFSTCLGCGATDADDCADGCWVAALDAALNRYREACK